MLLVFEDIGCEVRIRSSDGHYVGSIQNGKLNHVKSGATANELRQIADKLDELFATGSS